MRFKYHIYVQPKIIFNGSEYGPLYTPFHIESDGWQQNKTSYDLITFMYFLLWLFVIVFRKAIGKIIMLN